MNSLLCIKPGQNINIPCHFSNASLLVVTPANQGIAVLPDQYLFQELKMMTDFLPAWIKRFPGHGLKRSKI
ncbi:MAG: hypothetical protein A2277_12250 [Desulfobacterales bacterium RIFOXYA12_FULL_46_15]|nr:MAG: hypothetical protein A2277_12250 [Desulfobacterales bacterium RIFOXYA12_FULL_46_15]